MNIQQTIQQTAASARKAFGSDINLMVARAKAFGNDDNCILVHGKRHAEAAKAFANVKGVKFAVETGRNYSDGDDAIATTEYTYTVVTF